MDHVVLVLSILTVTIAGAGTAAALVIHNRLRSRITGRVAFVTTVFLIALLTGVLSAYLLIVLPPEGYPGMVFTVAGMILGVLVYGGIFSLLRVLDEGLLGLHIAVFAVALLSQVGRAVLSLSGATDFLAQIRLPAIGAISVFLLYAGIIAVRSTSRIESATAASMIRRLGWLLVGFAPVSTLVYVLMATIPESYRPPVSLDFLFALLWSIILVSVFLRYLNKPEAEVEGGVSQSFREAYKITEREAEVIGLVAQGLSNQQIADQLYVSLATARTHIYNIFRKTDAKSRVDLLRIARQHRD